MTDAVSHARSHRSAIIVAAVLEVQCPHCGEAQPSPDDTCLWEPDQVAAAEGPRVCIACEEPFVIHAQSHASIQKEASDDTDAVDE